MTKSLLLALSIWIAQQTGLPLPREMPELNLVTEQEMCDEMDIKDGCEYIRAFYEDGVITARTSLDPTSLLDMSLLVHELTHHFQVVNHIKYACVGQSEPLAYHTQVRWLLEAGVKDPWKLIQSSEFTVATYAMCSQE